MSKPPLLLVEDDPAVRSTIVTLLECEGYPVEGAAGPIHRAIDPLTAPVEHAVSCDC